MGVQVVKFSNNKTRDFPARFSVPLSANSRPLNPCSCVTVNRMNYVLGPGQEDDGWQRNVDSWRGDHELEADENHHHRRPHLCLWDVVMANIKPVCVSLWSIVVAGLHLGGTGRL